ILSEEALDIGLANRVVPDHELFETALMWANKLAAQAPVALGRSRRSPTRATSTRASRRRRAASSPPSPARTPKRASAPSSASAPRSGAVSRQAVGRPSGEGAGALSPAVQQ